MGRADGVWKQLAAVVCSRGAAAAAAWVHRELKTQQWSTPRWLMAIRHSREMVTVMAGRVRNEADSTSPRTTMTTMMMMMTTMTMTMRQIVGAGPQRPLFDSASARVPCAAACASSYLWLACADFVLLVLYPLFSLSLSLSLSRFASSCLPIQQQQQQHEQP